MDKKRNSYLSRRDFLRLAGITTAAGLLSACGKVTQETLESKEATQSSGAVFDQAASLKATSYQDWINLGPRSTDEVILRGFTFINPDEATEGEYYDNKIYLDYVLKEWQKLYPKGKFEHETVSWDQVDAKALAYASAETPIDIAGNWSGAVPNMASAGIMQPLDPYMPKWWWDTRLKAQIEPPSAALWEGKLIMASYTAEITASIVRKDVFEQGGYSPKDIKTWDDLLKALQGVSAKTEFKKPVIMYLVKGYSTWDAVKSYFMDNGFDGPWDLRNKDAYIQSVEMLKAVFEYVPETALNWDWGDGEQAYWSGQGAFINQHGQWLIGTKDRDTVNAFPNTAVMPHPYGPSDPYKKGTYSVNSTGFMIFTKSKIPQVAADWIACATTTQAEYLAGPAHMPGTSDWTVDDRVKSSRWGETIRPWMETWLNLMQNTEARVNIEGGVPKAREEITQFFYERVIDLYRGDIQPADFYTKMYDFVTPLLEG